MTEKSIGYIYKIVVDNQNMIYVGSTKNLRQRKHIHKSHYKIFPEKKLYLTMKELGITEENFKERVSLVWVEDCVFNHRHELTAREKHWIQELKPSCNIRTPYGLPTEEGIKERRKEDYQKNKEKYKLKSKTYYHQNKEICKEKRRKTSKAYYHQNKEKCKEYQKKYTEENRDKIILYQRKYREKQKKAMEKYKQQLLNTHIKTYPNDFIVKKKKDMERWKQNLIDNFCKN